MEPGHRRRSWDADSSDPRLVIGPTTVAGLVGRRAAIPAPCSSMSHHTASTIDFPNGTSSGPWTGHRGGAPPSRAGCLVVVTSALGEDPRRPSVPPGRPGRLHAPVIDVPITLGRGVSLWEGSSGLETDHRRVGHLALATLLTSCGTRTTTPEPGPNGYWPGYQERPTVADRDPQRGRPSPSRM